MTNPQGTQWETDLVLAAKAVGLRADRFPKRGQKGEPDLWIGTPDVDSAIPVLAWKRLTGKKSDGRRKPDGARQVAVLDMADFLYLIRELDHCRNFLGGGQVVTVMVQAKWAAALNPTRVLGLLQSWLKAARIKKT